MSYKFKFTSILFLISSFGEGCKQLPLTNTSGTKSEQSQDSRTSCPAGFDELLCSYTTQMAYMSRRAVADKGDPQCRRHPDDPYDGGTVFRNGRDTGLCVKKSLQRPLVWLKPEEAADFGFTPDNNHIVVAGIEDIGETNVVARIPFRSIKDIYMHSESFTLGGYHAQMRMTFSEPVQMRPQYPASANAPILESNDLIFSITATTADKDHNGATVTSLDSNRLQDGSFGIVYSGITLRQRISYSWIKQGNTISQMRLKLYPQQNPNDNIGAIKILLNYLDTGEKTGQDNPPYFHILNENCYTQQMRNLSRSIGTEPPVPVAASWRPSENGWLFQGVLSTFTAENLGQTYPQFALMWNALAKRGLIDENSKAKTLHEEFPEIVKELCANPPVPVKAGSCP